MPGPAPAVQTAGKPPAMSSSSSRTVRVVCVILTLVCVIAGAWAGITLSALSITAQPQQFRSLAKLVAGGPQMESGGMQWKEQLQDFYGTIIETVESPEMVQKARERVHALNPDLKDSDVSIVVRQTKGSAIFNILATGSEPKYTQIFLNALLDEFIAFRQIIREQAQGKVLSVFLQEVVNKQKTMEEALEAQQAAGRDAANVIAKIELERLKERLKLLGNERDDLRMALKGTPPDAAEKTARANVLEEEIGRIGDLITQSEAPAATLEATRLRAEAAKTAYEGMFTQAERFQAMFNTRSDYVAIQERASPAMEAYVDWKMPMITAGGAGAAAGLIAGLIISFIISMLGRSNEPQQAVS